MKTRLIGQYQIQRRLGSGTGGVVYQAYDTKLLRPVVLKMMRRRSASSEAMRRTMLREARLASAIDHPNVCSIYEVGETGGQAFIVMQHVPGRRLDELIEAGPLKLPLVLSVGIQIAEGLSAAHRLGIVHRDLKPANVMLTDGGLVKILDFGLARRQKEGGAALARPWSPSTVRGTTAYMAPEQFVTGQSGEPSDIFALGVILYEMAAGRHPFERHGAVQAQTIRAIQFAEPERPRAIRPDLPEALESAILKALAKNPAERFASAGEVREALRALMMASRIENGLPPAELAAHVPTPDADRRTGLFSMLAERFMRHGAHEVPPNSIAVLPFRDIAGQDGTPLYGLALADAVAARLARLPSVVVRAASALAAGSTLASDPVLAGRELLVTHVLSGTFLRSRRRFTLNWQLLEVATSEVKTGATLDVESLDIVAIQNEIAGQVFAELRGSGAAQPRPAAGAGAPLEGELSELYLEARALLSSFVLRSSSREDLYKAQDKLAEVLERRPRFAPAHSGLGVAHLHYVRKGFGGRIHLMAAQKCFEAALEIDPDLLEANLHGVYTLLARGEKESARHAVHRLLDTAGNDFEVHIVAGVILRLDGLFDAALREFGTALALNPAGAVLVYEHRARIYGYQGQLELALQEIEKGLMLEPRHPALRTSLGYLRFRQSDYGAAVSVLESVIEADRELRIAYPTLALCHLAAGDRVRARTLITEEALTSADADGEMAYRLATYFAFDGDAFEALHWLRKAIYLGNENHPWFAQNPAWAKLRGNEDLGRILSDLERTYRRNRRRWERVLSHLGTAVGSAP